MPTVTTCSEMNKVTRYTRPWYIVPFVVYMAMIFCAGRLVTMIDEMIMEETMFPFPVWVLYACMAVVAPSSLALCRLLPDPSLALILGGILTSSGLMWAGMDAGSSQIMAYCGLTGIGVCLSLQAIGIALSPYFIRDNVKVSAALIALSVVTMVTYPVTLQVVDALGSSIFIYLCPMVLVSSTVPGLFHLYAHLWWRRSGQEQSAITDLVKTALLHQDIEVMQPYITEYPTVDFESGTNSKNSSSKSIRSNDGWIASFISVVVWLTWGAGVDTTWLSMGWHFNYFKTNTGLAALQLILCLMLLTVKMVIEFSNSDLFCRANLASNYMQLGILGACGVISCLFPEHTHPFHNHLLFTVGLALQYDDLSDLYLVPHKSTPGSAGRQYQLVKYHIKLGEGEMKAQTCAACTVCHLACHMVSLLLMSVLAMILGVQVANFLGYLSTLPPMSFLCTRASFLVMSVVAVGVSLTRPDTYFGRRYSLVVS